MVGETHALLSFLLEQKRRNGRGKGRLSAAGRRREGGGALAPVGFSTAVAAEPIHRESSRRRERGTFICVVVQPSSGLSSLVPHCCCRGGRTRRVPCRRLGVRRQTRLEGREVRRQRRAERDSQLPSRRIAVTSTARHHRTRCGLQPRHRQSRLLCHPCCGWCRRRRPTIVGKRERVREGESRRRRTVAELSLPLRPAAVRSLVADHGGVPVSSCRQKTSLPSPKDPAGKVLSIGFRSLEFSEALQSLHVSFSRHRQSLITVAPWDGSRGCR
nr:uncharacterized protein LOC112780993 [Arachis hypogaea]